MNYILYLDILLVGNGYRIVGFFFSNFKILNYTYMQIYFYLLFDLINIIICICLSFKLLSLYLYIYVKIILKNIILLSIKHK